MFKMWTQPIHLTWANPCIAVIQLLAHLYAKICDANWGLFEHALVQIIQTGQIVPYSSPEIKIQFMVPEWLVGLHLVMS